MSETSNGGGNSGGTGTATENDPPGTVTDTGDPNPPGGTEQPTGVG